MSPKLIQNFNNFLMVVLFSTLLMHANTYIAPLVTFALASLIFFIFYWCYLKWQPLSFRSVADVPWQNRWIIWVFIGYFLSFVFFLFYHQDEIRFLDNPSKFVGFSLLLFYLTRYPINKQYLFLSINLAAFIGGCIAVAQVYYYGNYAAFTNLMKIQAGDIAMSLGLFSLLITFYHWQKKSACAYFSAVAAVLGVGASFLSETRGAWVCLPLLFVFVLWRYRKSISNIMYASIGVVTLAVVVYFIFVNPIQRIELAISEVANYSDIKNTSVGIRLDLWKSAIYSWLDKPYLGWGEIDIYNSQAQHAQQGLIDKQIPTYRFHAHNQFLEELTRRGLLGLLMFLSVLLLPVLFVIKGCKKYGAEVNILTQMAILHVFLVGTYCLTQAFFNHTSGVIFYLLTWVSIASAITSEFKTQELKKK